MEETLRILIVEDEGIQAMALEETLEREGYEVVGIVDNGEEALSVILEQDVDIVILDVQIKGDWDGIETARQILAVKKMPFIYLTAFLDPATLKRAEDTNPAAYLTKPYREANLREAVAAALLRLPSGRSERH